MNLCLNKRISKKFKNKHRQTYAPKYADCAYCHNWWDCCDCGKSKRKVKLSRKRRKKLKSYCDLFIPTKYCNHCKLYGPGICWCISKGSII